MPKIPKINKRAVCISLDSKYDLVREISTYFREEDSYFSVFKFLDLKEERRDIAEFDEDGYFAQLLGGQNSTYINNAIAKINPEYIIFAGMSENQKSFFSSFPAKKILNIDSVHDIEKHPKLFTSKISDIKLGTYEQIVVIEDEKDLSSVIAENLAFSMKAKIEYVEKTGKYLDKKIANLLLSGRSELSTHLISRLKT